MSRIQDILAKAERDGTTRRTHTAPTLVSPPPPAPAPAVQGTAALSHNPFIAGATAVSPEMDARAASARVTIAETRTAIPTLHPALLVAIAPQSPVADEYRAIRTRLMAHDESVPLRTIAVTSPGPGEGKSITVANLALTMAQEFQRNVLLVDAHLRDASIHSLFGVDRGPGLADVLMGDATLEDALVHLPDCGLTLLPAGAAPQFPTELLGSAAMRRALDSLRARFDRVLLDLPAATPLADVGTVAPLADGVLMVVRAGTTQRPALDDAMGVFEPGKVVGIVLNDAR